MNISKEKVREIAKKFNSTIFNEDDAKRAFWFVWEIICAEYDATKEKEPYAKNALDRLETAEHEVFDLMDEVEEAMSGYWA